MADFNLYYLKLDMIEGGFVDDPDDRGGETYAGITRKFFSDWIGWSTIDNFQEKVMKMRHNQHLKNLDKPVKEFYKKEFWDRMRLDEVQDQKLAEQVCDFGINSGINTSITKLQELANENYNTSLVIDGLIGNKTLNTINGVNYSEYRDLLPEFKLKRIEFYKDICKRDKSQKVFFYGWARRVLELN